jgi:hypothetical protein
MTQRTVTRILWRLLVIAAVLAVASCQATMKTSTRLVSVDVDSRACTIQWVKAAPGSGTFKIPQGSFVEPEPQSSGDDRVTRTVPQLSPSNVAQLDEQWKKRDELTKKVDSLLAGRQSLIQYCMDVLEKAASEPNKASLNPVAPIAVRALGQLGAAQAAPILVRIIDVPLLVSIVSEESIRGTTLASMHSWLSVDRELRLA